VTRKPADRSNQKRRARKALLEAAGRLMRDGGRPTLEEVAEEALISRATAYRYFSGLDALLVEASLDVETPTAETLFGADSSSDPVARVQRADAALHEMMVANEPALRRMLIQSLERGLKPGDGDLPSRQNRRTPLIEAALAPARGEFEPKALDRLTKALAMIVGTEGMVAAKDVLQLSDDEARQVKRWAIQALVDAARKPR
jgi:AcrR family transcriptional regulator